MALTLTFFGTFNAALDGEQITRFEADTARALLVYLTLNPGTTFRRDFLASLLWPDLEQTAALHALRQALNRLRGVLHERKTAVPLLNITRHTIQCNPERTFSLDVHHFTALLAATESHPHRRLAACRPCLDRLAAAVDLYQGDLLAGFHLDSLPFEEWLLLQRERLHMQALNSLHELTEVSLRRGNYERASHYAQRQLALENWREEAHQQMLRVLAHTGQRSAALAHYAACQQVLAQEFGVEPSQATQQLYTAIRDERPLPTPTTPPYRVPAQFTPLIGRQQALAQLATQLNNPNGRLLSLVGPGGAGKTRLALALAEMVKGDFADGIFFVPLTAVDKPDLILPTLARALTFAPHEEQSFAQQLHAYLSNRDILLIFDNFEQLTAGADILLTLLHQAPQLVCLITSRERLNAPGEAIFLVSGLSYETSANAEAAPAPSAQQLFMTVARRLTPALPFSQANQHAIHTICRLVDGNPLAIELAATWTRALSCPEIAAEIQTSLDFLTAPSSGRPERHHSLRAVFDHSWKLLNPTEQDALRHLAVFRGSFDREAAQQVANVPSTLLVSLLDQSLLQQATDNENGRSTYMMHDLTQRYALEKLADDPDAAQASRNRHARYFLTWLAAQQPNLIGPAVKSALAAIEAIFANIEAAWHWARHQGHVALLDEALMGLFLFYDARFWTRQGERVMGETAVSLADHSTRPAQILYQRLRVCQGWFATLLKGEVKQGCAHLAEAVAALRELDATDHLPFALNALARTHYHLSDYPAARQAAEESHALSQQLGDTYNIAFAQHILGQIEQIQGRYAASLTQLQAGLALARQAQFFKLETGILRALGVAYWRQGQLDPAQEYFGHNLQNCRAINDRYGEGKALTALGAVSFLAEDIETAAAFYQEGLHVARDIGDRRNEGQALNNLAEVMALRKEYAQATRLCQASLQIKRELGDLRGAAMTLGNLANMVKYQGDYAAAEQYLNEALAIFVELQDTHGQALALAVLTGLAGEQNQPEQAVTYGQTALKMTETAQQRHIHANVLTNLAHALADLGRWPEAEIHYTAALDLRQALAQPALAAETLAGLAEVALAADDIAAAQKRVNQILADHQLAALRGIDQLFRLHAVCLRVLAQANDPRLPELAQSVYAELQAHAAKIDRRQLRQQFLTEIAPHRIIDAYV